MKTYKNIFPRICAYDNLYFAWRDAARGKRKSPEQERQRGPVPVACVEVCLCAPAIYKMAPAFVVGSRSQGVS